MRFSVIGISDHPAPWFPPEVLNIIHCGKVFSGGRRHHEIVAPLLPESAAWIDITAPLDAVFEQYNALASHCSPLTAEIVVFASGDPLFFGFANTIKRRLPDAEIVVYPTFNALQMLAHRLVMPYHDMRIVSLTGRPWHEFDRALIERAGKIGVLTDREHTPAAIARRMMEYGYTCYQMHVGERLGNPAKEKVATLALEEAANKDFEQPNCLILCYINCDSGTAARPLSAGRPFPAARPLSASRPLSAARPFGILDSEFTLLNGREKMITKMPIRLLTLQALDLPRKHVFWDIGFCTGSVSIEARLQFPHLQIEAFEVRPECEAIIQENLRRFGAPGINLHIGDFLNIPLPSVERPPEAVFIGGHGGRLKEIMARVLTVLADDGCIVMNSVKAPLVKTDSHRLWDEACRELGLQQEPPLHISLNDYHPIEILKCHRQHGQ